MHTHLLRSALLAALATPGLLIGATKAVAAQPDSVAQTATAQAAAPVYMTTEVTQWTHYTPDWHNESHAGTLYAGRNYFYCFTYSVTYTGNGRTSSVWLKTDDDTGHHNVWVSDVNLTKLDYIYDVNMLPHC